MMDKETYKRELVRMWDSLRTINKGKSSCDGVLCGDCPLQGFKYGCSNALSSLEIYCAVEKWSKEHPPKKYKVSQLEYDILKSYLDYKNHMTVDIADYFFEDGLLLSLLKKGYFQGATLGTDVKEYFKNCEVKEDV